MYAIRSYYAVPQVFPGTVRRENGNVGPGVHEADHGIKQEFFRYLGKRVNDEGYPHSLSLPPERAQRGHEPIVILPVPYREPNPLIVGNALFAGKVLDVDIVFSQKVLGQVPCGIVALDFAEEIIGLRGHYLEHAQRGEPFPEPFALRDDFRACRRVILFVFSRNNFV